MATWNPKDESTHYVSERLHGEPRTELPSKRLGWTRTVASLIALQIVAVFFVVPNPEVAPVLKRRNLIGIAPPEKPEVVDDIRFDTKRNKVENPSFEGAFSFSANKKNATSDPEKPEVADDIPIDTKRSKVESPSSERAFSFSANEKIVTSDPSRRPSDHQMQLFEAKLPHIGTKRNARRCTPSNRCLVHLHIGKNGGTSIDSLGRTLSNNFIGGQHFDWSYIQGTIGMENADVILMLREPVSRSLSHFYFTQQVYGSPKIRAATLSRFLSDPEFLLEERGIWQDGQASVSWITGSHIAAWAHVPKEQVALRDELGKPSPALLHLAADRLEQTKWFGIIEDVPRSMELLQHALGLDFRPVLPHANRGAHKVKAPRASPEEIQILEYLTPMDQWLYAYGKDLFEARWEAYQRNISHVELPDRPPYPEIPCWSTRFELHCDKGPLKGNHTWSP